MGSEPNTLALGEVASVRSGFAFKSSDWTESGTPVVKIGNVKDGRLTLDNCSYVPKQVVERAHEFALRAGDILIAMTGYVGEVAIVRDFDLPAVLNQRVGRFTIRNPRRLSELYLYYVLRSPAFRSEVEGLAYGSAQPNISPKLIEGIHVPIPPITTQNAIVRVLGALDDKIELNRRMSETLDDIARAQFDESFLGTDSPLSTESPQVSVLRFFDILSGGTPKTSEPENWGGPIPWFSVADTPPGSTTFVLDTAKRVTERGIETSPAQVVTAGTTIISARGTVGKLAMAGVPLAFNQSCYGLQATNGAGPSFVFLLANHIVEKLKALAHGSVFSTITRRTFDAIHFPCPSKATLKAFEDRVAPLYQRILVATQESAALAELRDTLLPKLITGELRIPDAEHLVSEVA